MRITEKFVHNILEKLYPETYQEIYDNNMLLQYLDKKVKNPNNPSILLDVVLVKITLKNGGNI